MVDVLNVRSLIEDAPTRVAVFAYGTLRPGEALAHLIDTVDSEPGEVYGYALYHRRGGAFPFLVRERGYNATGDLLWVRPNERLLETVLMEVRAGYQVEVVNVYTSGMEEPTPALTFTYPYRPWGADVIETGDWSDVEVKWPSVQQ